MHCNLLDYIPAGISHQLLQIRLSMYRVDMKLVLSCGHDGSIMMWGAGGGVIDKIQVILFLYDNRLQFCFVFSKYTAALQY